MSKINVDVVGGEGENQKVGTIAAIARNEARNFLSASTMIVEGDEDSEVLKALACHEVLALAEDLLLSHVHIACDCLAGVNNLMG